MLRLNDDRGAAAVIIAILMVPLLGFAAISLDVAAMHAEKQQLQTGADAAALAIAQDCARKACGSPGVTAQTLAAANSNSGKAVATLPTVPTAKTGRVTVQNSAVRKHWFAPVLGVDESEISVRASASWGAPIGGTAALPLILTLCEFNRFAVEGFPTGVEQTIITTPAGNCLDKGNKNTPPHWVPGGFGWLAPTEHKSCYTKTRVGQQASSSPGNNMNQCDISAIRDRTILLPLFDSSNSLNFGGNGANAWYRVYGYAAFHVTGYYFSGQSWDGSGSAPCRGNERCIRGYFTTMVHTDPNFDYGPGAPNLGAAAVFLLPD